MKTVDSYLDSFPNKKILIIGDVMLDHFIEGNVSRISPEAPVPIVKVSSEFYNAGGAGNVALNVASLGGKASLFSFVGNDNDSNILKKILEEKKIECFFDKTKITTKKTRVVGKGQQLIRFDHEDTIPKKFNKNLKKKLIETAKVADIIIISDYAKGTISQSVISLLSDFKKKTIVDPKPINKNLYRNMLLIKSNEKESSEMAQTKDIEQAGQKLRKELSASIMITRSEKGMVLFSDRIMEIPTFAREVYDVSGAGDTVIAALALSLASTASLEDAAIIANHAAGIAVEKKGTYAVSLKELKSAFSKENKKITNLQELTSIVQDLKRKNKTIVWTNGCFDLVHIGHVKYLKETKALGDVLIVGLNSDESVKKIKGPARPIQSELERAEIISSLHFVNYVIIFSEDNVVPYLKALAPDIYAKGGDYTLQTINQEERKIVESYGGNINLLSHSHGKSTTDIIKKIKET